MLFVFRGTRGLQVVMALVTLAAGVGGVLLIKNAIDNDAIIPMLAGVVLALLFFYAFMTTLRLPTSYVAVSDERTRVRLGGFADQVLDNRNIEKVTLGRHSLIGGIGIRTNFGGTVGLISAPGEVADIHLRQPVRIWLIPRLIPVKARVLRVSIRNPQLLVERFAGGGSSRPPAAANKMPAPAKRRRR